MEFNIEDTKMNPIVKQIYDKLIEPVKNEMNKKILLLLKLDKILCDDILWLIANELTSELKKEPIIKHNIEVDTDNIINKTIISYNYYNYTKRYKYDLPSKIELCKNEYYYNIHSEEPFMIDYAIKVYYYENIYALGRLAKYNPSYLEYSINKNLSISLRKEAYIKDNQCINIIDHY